MDKIRRFATDLLMMLVAFLQLPFCAVAFGACLVVCVASAVVVYIGYLAGVSDHRAVLWEVLRAFAGEPSQLSQREHSPHAKTRRAACVCKECDAAGQPDPKLPSYEAARLEGDEKHESPPLELRERLAN